MYMHCECTVCVHVLWSSHHADILDCSCSQDASFNENIHQNLVLQTVPWFKETTLTRISLGRSVSSPRPVFVLQRVLTSFALEEDEHMMLQPCVTSADAAALMLCAVCAGTGTRGCISTVCSSL